MGYSDYVAHRRDRRRLRAMFWWTLAAFAVALLVAIFPYNNIYTFYVRHLRPGIDGKQIVEFTGVVTEYPSGKPVEGAFAIVSLHGFQATGLRAGSGGCAVSVALRTDQEGRYRFRWDWLAEGRNTPDLLGTELRVYAPGMNYWPRRYWISNIARFKPDAQISRDDAPFAERLDWLDRMSKSECYFHMSGAEFAEFYRSVYAEYQSVLCGALDRDEASLAYLAYVKWEGILLRLHHLHWRVVSPPKSDEQWREQHTAIRKEIRRADPDYPWPRDYLEGERNPPRDFSSSEKRALCTALAPEQMTWSIEP